mmetsp:Transcript_16894/g.21936  ORF Transcript_16894/g.21936 Transcript_16894/m.21936 type:complete len:668 (+) Transcript_16894:105-2108(+)
MPNHLCSFDSLNEFFISISNDNRIKIWETSSGNLKHQYVEKGHLSTKYTCFDWYRPATKVSRKRNSSGSRGGLGKLAVGTNSGTITVWDLQRGVVTSKLGATSDKHGDGSFISSVSFSSDGTKVYSSSRENSICEWNLESGELTRKMKGLKQGASIISLHPSGSSLAVAGTGIKMIDTKSGKRIRKFKPGHANKITCLAFSRDGRYLAAAASASRLVTVFLCIEKGSTPWAVTLSEVPSRLDLQPAPNQEAVDLIACSSSGALMVVRLAHPQGKAVGQLQIQTAEGKTPCGAIMTSFTNGSSKELFVSHGSESTPAFERLNFLSSEGNLSTSPVTLSLVPDKVDSTVGKGAKKAKLKKEEDPEMTEGQAIAMGDLGIKGTEVDSIAESSKAKKGEKGKKKQEVTPTIAERLQSLTAALEGRETDEDSSSGSKKKSGKGGKGKMVAAPTADSLATIIEQALQSSDEALLEHCLANHDPVVVSGSVTRLSGPRAVALLKRLVAKFEKRPSRVDLVATWVKAVISAHAGFLAGVSDLARQLANLYQVIDHRLSVYPKLLALSGRMELLMSQLPPSHPASPQHQEDLDLQTKVPLVVFKGGKEEEDEDEEDSAESADEGTPAQGKDEDKEPLATAPASVPKMNGVMGEDSEETDEDEGGEGGQESSEEEDG